ncbi:paired immunoglobulin-like type 2 receptor alpha isoform 1-T1 [Pangshura tecta]
MLPPRGWHWKGSDYDAGLLWAQLPNFSPHPRHPPPAVSSSRYCNRLPRPVFQLASSPRPGQGVLGGVAGAPGSHTSSPARPEMLLPPGHPALLLLVGMLLGAAAQDPGYTITQPKSLSAPAGGSVTLPCAFTYPAEIEPLRDLRVHWRRGGFHGEFIYNHTERFTHWDYRGRIALVGDPRGNRTASICIDQLRESDASEYVCLVRVQKNKGTWEQWRHHPGTQLTVTVSGQASTTHAPCTEQALTPATATTQRPAGLGAAPVIGGALAGAVLLAGIIGLAVYGARKRTGGRRKDPSARRARGQSQAEGGGEYMEIGARGQDVPPPQRPPDPQEPGLLYAALAFTKPGTAPRQPEPRGAPTDETLYSAVRIR